MSVMYSGHPSSVFAEVVARLNIEAEYYWKAERLVPFEHWVGHIPFAFWVVKALQPRRIVELGTHRGNSYFAMCQAVSALGLGTQTFAVDTWSGDLHMDAEEGIFEELQAYHNPRYANFSTLMRMTFDKARPLIEDGSIDLLHIDGTHTYEAVRQDFERWKTALSPRAVVLFHDTVVRSEQFGVWKLWKELASEYPSFEFQHSYGLGVLGVGIDQNPLLQTLFAIAADEESTYQVRSLFAARGDAHVTRLMADETARLLRELEQRQEAAVARHSALMLKLEGELTTTQGALAELQQLLEAEQQSMQMRETALRGTLAAERNAAYKALAASQEAATAAVGDRARLIAIESSTIWRMSRPISGALSHVPARYRRLGRGVLKAGWWAATGKLLERMRQRRVLLAASTCAPAPVRAAVNKRSSVTHKLALPDLQTCKTAIPQARLAVLLHVHFADLWPELDRALSVMPEAFDLFASVTAEAGEFVVANIRASYPNAHVHVFPNHGRDILPFLAFAQTGVLNNYAAVLKLHTKRSLHAEDGDTWRQNLINGVLGSADRIRQILTAFEKDPDLGIVVADDNIYGDESGHWRDTRDLVLHFGNRIGIWSIPPEARFPGGSIYWIRPFLLRTLAGMNVSVADFEPEPIGIDGTAAHAVERLVGLVCHDASMKLQTTSTVLQPRLASAVVAKQSNLHLIAYYLPQFHPVEENNRWWGQGFTEWTNVTRATPSFPGHRQPRLPTDLGFYDLRLSEIREAQAALASQYGISAFCYYYYWFDGGRGILRQPLDDMLASSKPDFPFLICWANEPWTRNWDGGNREVLLPQTYHEEWPEAFARDIAPILRDPRYFRLEGLPVLLIYRVMHIPAQCAAFNRLRAELRRFDVGEIHLSGGWVGFGDDEELPSDPGLLGLDAFFEFPPHRLSALEITGQIQGLDSEFTGHIYSYDSAIDSSLAQTSLDVTRHHAVMLGWDNTARNMRRGHIFHGATPAKFRRWLREILRIERSHDGPENRLVFINGWNEWAEGAHLEPDRDFGRGWLEAVASASSEPILLPNDPVPQDGFTPALSAIVSDEEWLQRVIAKAEGHNIPGMEDLPAFPAPAWQVQFVGSTNANAMREAFSFYKLVKNEAACQGIPILDSTRVLDFGCGWGRFIRLWMKDISATSLYGVDVDPDMIGFCRISGLPARFDIIPPFGPTAFEPDALDLIFAYSVFSHLAESAYDAWMAEFGRILRPGGIIVFSTQSKSFLEATVVLRDRPEPELSDWQRSLRTAFPDTAQTIANYDCGNYVFAATGGGDHRLSSFYGEAAIPLAYLERTASRFGLRLTKFIDTPSACPQAVAVMVKL